jgi:fructose-specific phosphotransferase system IIC component
MLIRMSDGVLVEVQPRPDEAEQVSASDARAVAKRFEQIKEYLPMVIKPFQEFWDETATAKKAEIDLGLGFETEGSIFLAKAKATATVTIKLTFERP